MTLANERYFPLPEALRELVAARNRVRDHYAGVLIDRGATAALTFQLDGNLLGDLGEALAVEQFGIRLIGRKAHPVIDGYSGCGKSVQVKVTASGRGPAFRWTKEHADHLLFFDLDLKNLKAEVIFNGPERKAREKFRTEFAGQRSLTTGQIRAADLSVEDHERLPMSSERRENLKVSKFD